MPSKWTHTVTARPAGLLCVAGDGCVRALLAMEADTTDQNRAVARLQVQRKGQRCRAR